MCCRVFRGEAAQSCGKQAAKGVAAMLSGPSTFSLSSAAMFYHPHPRQPPSRTPGLPVNRMRVTAGLGSSLNVASLSSWSTTVLPSTWIHAVLGELGGRVGGWTAGGRQH